MNIKELDKDLRSEVRQDEFKNPIRVGDAVYFMTNQLYGINLGIISKFCPCTIKVNNGKNEYSVSNFDIVKVNSVMNDDMINDLKKKVTEIYNEKEKARKIVTRYVWFLYKSRSNEDRGIGWWMINDERKNHKSIITKNIKKMNEDDYDIWFANYSKENDSIYFDNEPNVMPRESGIFTKPRGANLTYIEHTLDANKNEIRLFKYIEDQNIKDKATERMKKLADDYEKSKGNRRTLYYKSAKELFLKFDSDLLFEAVPPKKGKIKAPFHEGVSCNSIMVDEKLILINCIKDTTYDDKYNNKSNFELSFLTFKEYALNDIELKFNYNDENIKSFFDMIKNKMQNDLKTKI